MKNLYSKIFYSVPGREASTTRAFACAIRLAAFVMLASLQTMAATRTSKATGGNWATTTTWVGGVVPVAGDDVVIATTGGNEVTIAANITIVLGNITVNDGAILTVSGGSISGTGSCNTLTIGSGTSGTLQFNSTAARTIVVNANATINAGGVLTAGSTGTQNNVLTIAANLLVYGTYSGLSSATTGNIALTVGANIIVGDGATYTNGRNSTCSSLTVGGGASGIFSYNTGTTARNFRTTGAGLIINPGAIFKTGDASTLANTLTISNGGNLTIYGTYSGLSSGSTGTIAAGVSGDILINDGGTYTNGANSTCANLTVGNGTSGIFSFNTSATGRTFVTSGATGITINAGAILKPADNNTTANTLTLNNGGNLTINGTYSGLSLGSTGTIAATATTGNIIINDGGTYINGANSGCTNLIVGSGTSGLFSYNTGTVARSFTTNAITINAGAIFKTGDANAIANTLSATSITVNGTYSGLSSGSTGTIAATVSGNIAIGNGGSFTNGAATSCGNLIVGSGSSGLFQFNSSATVRTVTVNGNVTVNNGATLQAGSAVVAIANVLDINGNFINAGTFTPLLSSGINKITLAFTSSTVNQVFSNTGTITNNELFSLTINNTFSGGTVTVPGNMTVTDGATLTLTSGILTTPNITLGKTTAATLSGGSATSYINGAFTRSYSATSATINAATFFPIGKGTTYLPIYLAPTLAVSALTQLKAEAFTSNSGTNISPSGTIGANRWEASVPVNAANLNLLSMRIGSAAIVSTNRILKSTSAAGAYSSIVPNTTYTAATPNTLTSTATLTGTEFTGSGFFCYGDACYPAGLMNGPSSICTGATSQLYATAGAGIPAAGTWSSSAPGVATVDLSGNVTGVSAGLAPITLTVSSADICNAMPITRIITISNCSATPGGVGSNLVSWYKGDAGLTSSLWTDQAGSNNLAASGTITVTNTLNYNPVATLNGSSDYYGNNGADGWLGTSNATTYYYVATGDAVAASNRVVFGRGNANGALTSMQAGRRSNNNAIFGSGNVTNAITPVVSTTTPVWSTTTPVTVLSRSGYDGINYYVNANGSTEVTAAQAGLTIAGAAPFYIGRAATSGSFWSGNVAEVIAFNNKQNSADYNKVESYLAVKYGITLNPSAGTYINSAGTTTYTIDATYKNQIIGIGRDDTSALLQKQSHTQDDSLRLFVSSLAASNAANGGTISSDKASILIGHDGGKLQNVYSTARPPGIYSRFGRVWKITNTNFSDSYSLEFEWDSVATFDINDVRLLVASSPSGFASAAIIAPGAVTYSIGSIIVSGINPSVIPMNATSYITIGSVSYLTPLPVKLISFTGKVYNCISNLTWSAAEEQSFDHFEVQQSKNGTSFTTAGNVKAGREGVYSFSVEIAGACKQYYRLKMVNNDGSYSYSNIISLAGTCDKRQIIVSPNPVGNQLAISGVKAGEQISIYSTNGQLMKQLKATGNSTYVDMSIYTTGLYEVVIRTAAGDLLKTEKIQKL
jgi:hypothetical protein